jgi:hypothetical protein
MKKSLHLREKISFSGGAAGSRTLVRRKHPIAFYMLSFYSDFRVHASIKTATRTPYFLNLGGQSKHPVSLTRTCLSLYAVYRVSNVLTKCFIILDYAASAKLFSPINVRLEMVKEYTIIPLHAYYKIIDPVDTSQPHMFYWLSL